MAKIAQAVAAARRCPAVASLNRWQGKGGCVRYYINPAHPTRAYVAYIASYEREFAIDVQHPLTEEEDADRRTLVSLARSLGPVIRDLQHGAHVAVRLEAAEPSCEEPDLFSGEQA